VIVFLSFWENDTKMVRKKYSQNDEDKPVSTQHKNIGPILESKVSTGTSTDKISKSSKTLPTNDQRTILDDSRISCRGETREEVLRCVGDTLIYPEEVNSIDLIVNADQSLLEMAWAVDKWLTVRPSWFILSEPYNKGGSLMKWKLRRMEGYFRTCLEDLAPFQYQNAYGVKNACENQSIFMNNAYWIGAGLSNTLSRYRENWRRGEHGIPSYPYAATWTDGCPWQNNNSCGRGPIYRGECLFLDPWDCQVPKKLEEQLLQCRGVNPITKADGIMDEKYEFSKKGCGKFYVWEDSGHQSFKQVRNDTWLQEKWPQNGMNIFKCAPPKTNVVANWFQLRPNYQFRQAIHIEAMKWLKNNPGWMEDSKGGNCGLMHIRHGDKLSPFWSRTGGTAEFFLDLKDYKDAGLNLLKAAHYVENDNLTEHSPGFMIMTDDQDILDAGNSEPGANFYWIPQPDGVPLGSSSKLNVGTPDNTHEWPGSVTMNYKQALNWGVTFALTRHCKVFVGNCRSTFSFDFVLKSMCLQRFGDCPYIHSFGGGECERTSGTKTEDALKAASLKPWPKGPKTYPPYMMKILQPWFDEDKTGERYKKFQHNLRG